EAGDRQVREAGVAEYELKPITGGTHQLRVHMNALGMPILSDPVYPVDLAPDPYDFISTLQLVAAEVAFAEPQTGRPRRCTTQRSLDAASVPVSSAIGLGRTSVAVEPRFDADTVT